MNDEQWHDLSHRVAGDWYYGVKTTKIFCRVGCSSRLPKRENVIHFYHAKDAKAAGFRACKRCLRSDNFNPVQSAMERMEAEGGPVSLAELSALTSLSSAQLRRRFHKATGLSPHQYGAEVRRHRFRGEMASGKAVIEAALEAGYGSTGHASDDGDRALGMTPTQFKEGGTDLVIEWAASRSSLGWVLVARTSRGVCCVEIDDSLESLQTSLRRHFPRARLEEAPETLRSYLKQFVSSLKVPRDLGHLPLDLQGTLFQKRVWQALREIPIGSTKTYGELARGLGKPKAYRAVARACATNKIAVAVPCHRVIGKNGSLTGYRWGIEVKRRLLELERRDLK